MAKLEILNSTHHALRGMTIGVKFVLKPWRQAMPDILDGKYIGNLTRKEVVEQFECLLYS